MNAFSLLKDLVSTVKVLIIAPPKNDYNCQLAVPSGSSIRVAPIN